MAVNNYTLSIIFDGTQKQYVIWSIIRQDSCNLK